MFVDDGVTILGVPIGNKSYVAQYLEDKFVSIDRVLTPSEDVRHL
jgi:hypothetical protein